MAIELPDARELSDESLQVIRLRALHGIELGFSETDLANLLGVCHETISRWWTAYCAHGLHSLPGGRTGRPLGSGRFLAEQQADRIQGLIDNHSPEQLGIAQALWTRRAVQELIRKEFDIDLAERTVGQYLRRWGYTLKFTRNILPSRDRRSVSLRDCIFFHRSAVTPPGHKLANLCGCARSFPSLCTLVVFAITYQTTAPLLTTRPS